MDSTDQSSSNNNKVVTDYLDAIKLPALKSAEVLTVDNEGKYHIKTEWSQRCIERSSRTKFRKYYTLDKNTGNVTSCTPPIDVSNELLSWVSRENNHTAIIREIKVPDAKDGKKLYLDIWQKHLLQQTHDLSLLDIHGDIYTDETFGSCGWCPFGKRVFYIAEEKRQKMEPFYKADGQKRVLDKEIHGREYEFLDDWGEQVTPKRQSVIVVCNKDTREVSIVSNIPSHVAPGGVIWKPDGNGFYGVGFSNSARMGIVYCTCRESFIFEYCLDTKQYRPLTESGFWVSSPRISPNGKYLVWLQRKAEGPHHDCVTLVKYTIATQTTRTVVYFVPHHISIENGKRFYGLYNIQLAQHCWLPDSEHVLLSTPQNYQKNMYLISTETDKIIEISRDGESCDFLNVFEDMILCSVSSYKSPNKLYAVFPVQGTYCNWIAVSDEHVIEEENSLEINYIDLKGDPSDEFTDYGALYFGPSSGTDRSTPLILIAHGGPHAVYSNEFSAIYHYFIRSGFALAFVNFRGSVGYGKKSVEYLINGHVGTKDVQDCYNAMKAVVEKYEFLDDKNVFLFGGSHGGFLVTHLAGQYPQSFTAVVTVNPVTHMSTMLSVTDIPDWAVVESGLKDWLGGNPLRVINSPETTEDMQDKSPMKYVNAVKAPTLLLLGKKDLRVPHSQGLMYYRLLKDNKVETKALVYDDNHALSTVAVEMDSIINTIVWFQKYYTKNT